MKTKSTAIALILTSGLIAGAPAFAQATPKQMPPAQMSDPADGKMMTDKKMLTDNKRMASKRDKSMGMHSSDSRPVSGTLNPKIRVY